MVFHSSIGKEEGFFDISDVIENVYNKMVFRHPHVFADSKNTDSKEVLNNWDELKKQEKGITSITDEMKSIAESLPNLIKAYKVQNKAKKVGFDWNNVEDAMAKVTEELEEIKQVYKDENKSIIEDEVGDLIFACVNVSRFLNIDGELALNKTIEKFIRRFSYIEETTLKNDKNLKELSLIEMDELWNEAKKLEKENKI